MITAHDPEVKMLKYSWINNHILQHVSHKEKSFHIMSQQNLLTYEKPNILLSIELLLVHLTQHSTSCHHIK